MKKGLIEVKLELKLVLTTIQLEFKLVKKLDAIFEAHIS